MLNAKCELAHVVEKLYTLLQSNNKYWPYMNENLIVLLSTRSLWINPSAKKLQECVTVVHPTARP